MLRRYRISNLQYFKIWPKITTHPAILFRPFHIFLRLNSMFVPESRPGSYSGPISMNIFVLERGKDQRVRIG